ncbi:lasso peptide biosynthesis B2 protein [Streptomyces sp. RKAG293]|uniref:lasso peptide biosynthesis B2 protein n=1 Tax=Streptomyces sp. RKAG293 TaxID=2893403 RepID=UPI0020344FF1|nr:lasso peptide biosynthesis B2 protein [Streptomyces sp. RKAG293]MCM2417314.1 lasso peptide biosynthesis B2 protein [Streptomyces sp. RKAG293]
MPDLYIPEHIHDSVAPHGGSVLLNAHSGQWYALNSTAHTLWQEWQRTGDFDSAVDAMAHRYPREQRTQVRSDAQELAAGLAARGLVVSGQPGERRSPGEPAEKIPAARTAPRSRSHRGLPQLAFAIALLLLRLPFRLTVALVGARQRWCRAAATQEQALWAVIAAEAVARRFPGRAACLELSLSAVVTMALLGRRLDWCIGTVDDPYRFHAWAEVDGVPVTHPSDSERALFRRVLSL